MDLTPEVELCSLSFAMYLVGIEKQNLAAEITISIKISFYTITTGNQSPNGFGLQRKHFENIKDNWRENEINNKVQLERQREMELLMNRFKKPARPQDVAKTNSATRQSNVHGMIVYDSKSKGDIVL